VWVSYQGNRKASSDFPLATHSAYTTAPNVRHTGGFLCGNLPYQIWPYGKRCRINLCETLAVAHGSSSPPALFSTVDTQRAADGTALQRELRCSYCPKAWKLHQYPAGERQGKWRVVEFKLLCDHMLSESECNHGSDDIRSQQG